MKNRKKVLAGLLVMCMTAASFSVYGMAEEEATSDDPLKIGVVTYLTGQSKETGDRQLDAIEYALSIINEAGGVNGQTVEVEYFDAGEDQQSCIDAIQLAINTEGIDAIVGSFLSQYNLAYSDIVKEAQIPCMCLGTSSNVRDQANPYMWMPRICDETTTMALARAAQEKGIKSPAVLYMTNSSGQTQHDAFVKGYEEAGLSIAADIGFDNTTTTDYSSIVLQTMDSEADGICLIGTSGTEATSIITLLDQYDYDKPICAVSAIFSSQVTDVVGDITDGIFGVGEFSLDSEREATQNYIAGYNEASGDFTAAWTDAVTYDAIMLICEGAKTAGENTAEGINTGLEVLEDYSGALTDYTYNEDHSLGKTLYYVEFQGSDIVTTGTFEAR